MDVHQDLTTAYCAPCDAYFPNASERQNHIQEAANGHPKCPVCYKRFLNKNTLRIHFIKSPHHHYCTSCDKLFESYGGLRVHLEMSSVHRDDSDDEDDYDSDDEDEDESYDSSYSHRYRYHSEHVETNTLPDEPYTFSRYQRHWEDEKASSLYPYGCTDPTIYDIDDLDFEDDHEYDFEDADELGDAPFEFGEEEDEDSEDGSDGEAFSCPMCLSTTPETVCVTTCGHLFCVDCIKSVLHYTGMCPVCDEKEEPQYLRRVFITGE
ncbi:hypothetical protein AAF712_009996 [Marasmius tenuissimus]|uniref:RING-type domain-containing protein n=1 Tax=Marasmius tenuissimus TaxID=585030 RepID=A0ABR2ZP09_9AGAR|nr:hypothetical protein PM082_004992 [Marasmius tenuissimus]